MTLSLSLSLSLAKPLPALSDAGQKEREPFPGRMVRASWLRLDQKLIREQAALLDGRNR